MSDSTTGIEQIDVDTAEIEVKVNENFGAGSPGLAFGLIRDPVALHVDIYEGVAPNASGVPTKVGNQGFDLTNTATNYLRRNADLTFTVTTSAPSGWPGPLASGAVALYSFVCAGGAVTSWLDYRLAAGTSNSVVKAAILAALEIDSWTWVGDDLTITKGGKSVVLTVT